MKLYRVILLSILTTLFGCNTTQKVTKTNYSTKPVKFRSVHDLNAAYCISMKNISNDGAPYYLIVKTPEYKVSRYILEQKGKFQEIDLNIVDKLKKNNAVTIQLTDNLESDINLAKLYINFTLIRDDIKVDSLSVREPIYGLETLFQPGNYKVFLESESSKIKPISKLIPISFDSFKNKKTLAY